MKWLVMTILVFSGCSNRIEVKCPDCDIVGSNDLMDYNCTGCTVESSSKDRVLFLLPSRSDPQ